MIGRTVDLEVYTVSRIPDGLGGFTESYTYLKTIQGVVSTSSSKAKSFLGINPVSTKYIIYTDDTSITEDKYIKFQQKMYVIKGIRNPNMLNHHLEIEVDDVSSNKSINR